MTTAPFLPMDAPENDHPPISDWRYAICGLQIAAISAEGIKPRTMEDILKDQSKRNVLRPAPRKDVKRPEGGAE